MTEAGHIFQIAIEAIAIWLYLFRHKKTDAIFVLLWALLIAMARSHT